MPRPKRATEEPTIEPTGQSTGPTEGKKKRKARQSKRELYQKVREDLQLSGDLPVTPEGALKSEVVDTLGAPQPKLIAEAIRRGWAVPEARKPDLVDELIKILDDPDAQNKVKVAAFNALRMADQAQYERDHPEQVAKIKGGATVAVGVTVQQNLDAAALIRGMVESGQLGILEEQQAPDIPSAPGGGRLERSMEGSTTPAGDQQRAGAVVADAEQ